MQELGEIREAVLLSQEDGVALSTHVRQEGIKRVFQQSTHCCVPAAVGCWLQLPCLGEHVKECHHVDVADALQGLHLPYDVVWQPFGGIPDIDPFEGDQLASFKDARQGDLVGGWRTGELRCEPGCFCSRI